jgi:hypothetical protein
LKPTRERVEQWAAMFFQNFSRVRKTVSVFKRLSSFAGRDKGLYGYAMQAM